MADEAVLPDRLAPGPRPRLAARRHHGEQLPALPGHRAGRRGGVLRRAVRAAAGLRARRGDRLRHQPARPRPDRRHPGSRSSTSRSRLLTDRAVDKIIEPTLDDVLEGGRFDVISLGFVLALWSGSRALNVFIDTITVMHGLGGHRGIIRTRALSFVLYVLALVTGIAAIPLMVAGPTLLEEWLPDSADFLLRFYWPVGRRDLHLLPGHALPPVGPGADELALQPPGRGVLAAGLGGRVLPAAVGADGDRGRLALDLRPARRADRGPAVALPGRDRRAHRGRGQRVVRHRLPTEGARRAPAAASRVRPVD